MSGIYIPNMEIPKDGYRQLFLTAEGEIIWFPTSPQDGDIRRQVIPIPSHGRLIDADAPIKVWEVKLSDGDSCSFRNIETTVSKFLLSHLMGEAPPTIIEAEEGE